MVLKLCIFSFLSMLLRFQVKIVVQKFPIGIGSLEPQKNELYGLWVSCASCISIIC